MNIWIVWAQYYDKSNEPEFLAAFVNEREASNLISIIEKTSPAMQVSKSEVWLKE